MEKIILRHIAVVTGSFPSRFHQNRGTFVRQMVNAMAEAGVRCTVIHPWKIHEWLREGKRDKSEGSDVVDGVQVYRPLTISVSNRRIGPWNTFELTQRAFRRATWRVLSRLPQRPDAIYGHFLYSGGATAVWAARRLGRPSFVAVGEGSFWTVEPLGQARARGDFADMTGAITVSSALRHRLTLELNFASERVTMFPNGADTRRFFPRDRAEMRRKHNLPQDLFLVIYVGNFLEEKGVRRVGRAIDGLPNVGGIFAGSGPCPPKGSNVLFSRALRHDQIPELLSAADCFVLPSKVEGSSNATVEAMACGLPVVVSEGEFNDDLVGPGSGIRVPPYDVAAIREAILKLQADRSLRNKLGKAAMARAAELDVRTRARRVLEWMAERASIDKVASGCGRSNRIVDASRQGLQ